MLVSSRVRNRIQGIRHSKYQIWKNVLVSRPFTFISKHFEVSKDELSKVLKDMKSPHRAGTNNNVEVKICNLCDKENKENSDNIWKLNVFQNGGYHCFRCGCSGGWFDLKDKVKKFNSGSVSLDRGFVSESFKFASDSDSNNRSGGRSQTPTHVVPKQKDAYSYTHALFPKDPSTRSPEAKKVLDYLMNVRGLSETVLLRYGVGVITQEWPDESDNWKKFTCVTFPWFQNKADRPAKKTGPEFDEDQSLENISDEVYLNSLVEHIYLFLTFSKI